MIRDPSPEFPAMMEILNFRKKKDLIRHCRALTIQKRDLVAFILAATHGVFAPYKYANFFADTVQPELVPTKIELASMTSNGVGLYKTAAAQKGANKIFQLFRQRRVIAAHLLYTADHRYWHLFYFDNHDRSKNTNHWKSGPHLHYVGDLWPELTLEETWRMIETGRIAIGNKLHIRYSDDH